MTEGSRGHLKYLSDAEVSDYVYMTAAPPPRARCAPQPCPKCGLLYHLGEHRVLPPQHPPQALVFMKQKP